MDGCPLGKTSELVSSFHLPLLQWTFYSVCPRITHHYLFQFAHSFILFHDFTYYMTTFSLLFLSVFIYFCSLSPVPKIPSFFINFSINIFFLIYHWSFSTPTSLKCSLGKLLFTQTPLHYLQLVSFLLLFLFCLPWYSQYKLVNISLNDLFF